MECRNEARMEWERPAGRPMALAPMVAALVASVTVCLLPERYLRVEHVEAIALLLAGALLWWQARELKAARRERVRAWVEEAEWAGGETAEQCARLRGALEVAQGWLELMEEDLAQSRAAGWRERMGGARRAIDRAGELALGLGSEAERGVARAAAARD